jgi:hypothetical protein
VGAKAEQRLHLGGRRPVSLPTQPVPLRKEGFGKASPHRCAQPFAPKRESRRGSAELHDEQRAEDAVGVLLAVRALDHVLRTATGFAVFPPRR